MDNDTPPTELEPAFKQVIARIDPTLHKDVRMIAARREETIQEVIVMALESYRRAFGGSDAT